MEVIIGKKS